MKEVKNYTVRVFKEEGYPTLKFVYNEVDYSNSEEALTIAKKVAEKYNKKGYSYCIFEETIKLLSMIVNENHKEIPDEVYKS